MSDTGGYLTKTQISHPIWFSIQIHSWLLSYSWLTSCQPCSLLPISSVHSVTVWRHLSFCGLQGDCRKPLGMGETEPRYPWLAQKGTCLLLPWLWVGLGRDYTVLVVLCCSIALEEVVSAPDFTRAQGWR